jgi:hypothetical protein
MDFVLLTLIISTISSLLRVVISGVIKFALSICMVSYTVKSEDNDELIIKINNYVKNNLTTLQTKSFTLFKDYDTDMLKNDFVGQRCEFNDGIYFFKYKNVYFTLCITNDNENKKGHSKTFTVMVMRWNSEKMCDFFKYISTVKNTSIYSYYFLTNFKMSWKRSAKIRTRDESSVIIPLTDFFKIKNDIKHFFESKEKYISLGICYKRGYMFYGKPGCGKTSFIISLANIFSLNIYIISLSSNINDEKLLIAISEIPEKSIVLFEDIDVIFPKPRNEDNNIDNDDKKTKIKTSKITMSGFLNAIDGISSSNKGLLFIFTTNYIDKLDDALIREGRVDFKMEFKYLNTECIRRMILKFRPNLHVFADNISKQIKTISPCKLNEMLIRTMMQKNTQFKNTFKKSMMK